jgi:hypothetical protein
MKTWLLAGTMLLGVCTAAPALAQDTAAPAANVLNGYVGASYGRIDSEVDIDGLGSFDGEADAWKLDGTVNIPAGPDWGVQLDGEYLNLEADDVDGDSWSGAAHIYRSGASGAVGLFGAVSDAEDATFYAVGAEALAYFDRFTLEGQLGYGEVEDIDGADFYAARGQARYFVNDNLRLDATGGFSRIAIDDVDDFDIVSYGVGAEYQLTNAPVSFYANLDRSEFEEEGIDADTTTFMVGARFTFGGTLKDRDRAGARWSSPARLFGGGVGASSLALIDGVGDDFEGEFED